MVMAENEQLVMKQCIILLDFNSSHIHACQLLRCVVFCFLSNLVPSSTVILPLLASRVLSEVARWQLLIVGGLSAKHLVAYVNLLLFMVKIKEIQLLRLGCSKKYPIRSKYGWCQRFRESAASIDCQYIHI